MTDNAAPGDARCGLDPAERDDDVALARRIRIRFRMPSLLRRVRNRLSTYNTPLPLDDFEGYDGYWEGRERGGKTTEILPRWKLAVEKIPDGASVLDVGCGSGGFLMYLREQRPNCRVRGTDISQHAVDLARERGLDTFQADLTVDKLEDEYDYITGFEMIEHVHEAEKVLVAMRDATRRQLILSLPNTGYIEHRARLALFGRFPNTQIKFHAKEHIRFWTVKDFRDWADHFDLDVVDIQGQWGLHFMPWRSRPALFSPQIVYTLQRR